MVDVLVGTRTEPNFQDEVAPAMRLCWRVEQRALMTRLMMPLATSAEIPGRQIILHI